MRISDWSSDVCSSDLVDEEVTAMGKTVVHFLQSVDDKIDRGFDGSGDAVLAHQPVIDLGPVFDAVGEPLVIDHDQQIIVGLVALCGMRLIDPTASRLPALKHAHENAPALLPFVPAQQTETL